MTLAKPPASTPERWREIKETFFLALEREGSERSVLLGERCGDDGELRAEVESLLAAHESLSRAGAVARSRPDASLSGFGGNDRFSLDAELGSGGFGVVYRAFDRELRRWVALKVLRNPDAEALVRFKREFRAIERLRLENLVRCFELFSEGRSLFFTMELVEGLPLLDHLRASTLPASRTVPEDGEPMEAGPVPRRADPARLTAVFAQLVRGVLGLHDAGWLHRDLKPTNVLVERSGRVVILDLGLARCIQNPENSTRVFGSPCYIAPELFANARPTVASDWYSVGVMLYEALTGRAPWSSSWLDLVSEKTTAEPPPPRSLVPGVPAHLDALCAELLRLEPERRPGGLEILRRLGGRVAAPAARHRIEPRSAAAPFVGREEHLAELRAALVECEGGRPSVVEVCGPSGIGKTALVQRFLEALRAERGDGVVILEGRCYPNETVGFKVFDGVVDALGHHLKRLPLDRAGPLLPRNLPQLVRVFPTLLQAPAVSRARGRASAEEAVGLELRSRAFDALAELLGRMAEERPLVIFVDDLHWGDRDSGVLLQHLLGSGHPPPVLLLVSYRSELNGSPVLADLRHALVSDAVARRRILVGELEHAEASRFAARVLGARHPSIPAIVQEAAGIPYFLHELVDRVRTEQAGSHGASRGPLRLDELLLARIEHLPPEARRLLEVLSLARKPLARRTAEAAAQLQSGADTFDLLCAARLARPVGADGRIEPYHDRIREVVETALHAGQRAELHRSLTRALEAHESGDAEQLALHFQAAGDRERAARHAAVAAEEAVASAAFDRAARLYRMALEVGGAGGKDRADLLARLGDAQANAGMGRQAAEAYGSAAGLDPSNARELRRRAAEQLLRIGETEEGLLVMQHLLGSTRWRTLDRAPAMPAWIVARKMLLRVRGLRFRARAEQEVPRDLLLRTDLAWTAFLGLTVVDPIRASFIQSRHVLDALAAGEPRRVARALMAEAALAGMRGMGPRYRRLMEALDRVCDLVPEPGLRRVAPGFARTVATYVQGRWLDCRKEGEATERALLEERGGAYWELAIVRAMTLATATLGGELRASQRRHGELLQEAEHRGDWFARASLALLGSSRVLRYAQDQPEVAERELQELKQRWAAERFPYVEYNAGFGLAETAIYAGRPDEAWRFFTRGASPAQRALARAFPSVRFYCRHMHARAAIALSEQDRRQRDRLLGIAQAEAQALRREKNPLAEGYAHLILAALASSTGDVPGAAEALASAERWTGSAGLKLLAMMARLCRGHLIPGPEGALLVREVEAWAAQEGVRQPYRMAATFVPGVL